MLDKIDVQKFKSKISADNPMLHGQPPPEIPPKDTPNPDPKVQNRKKETSNPPKDLNLNLT